MLTAPQIYAEEWPPAAGSSHVVILGATMGRGRWGENVNVFDLDQALVGDYQRFARSFTQIRAKDIRAQVEHLYSSNRFWPESLISINPHFERGAEIRKLVEEGSLHTDTGKVFRVGGKSLRLHRHQEQAVAKAAQRQSFVVTTGTGSGKSLCFFIPIIDSIIRRRRKRECALSPRLRPGFSG
jgi:hypothetical protein